MTKKKTIKVKDPAWLPSIRNPKRRLLAKIAKIREEIPGIEPTGVVMDKETGKLDFHYTEAQEVFKQYITALKRHKLLVRPYAAPGMMPTIATQGRLTIVSMAFEVVDLDTGEAIQGAGLGGGINLDWSANTGQTRALKQFLLTTFGATWQDPETVAKNEAHAMLSEARTPLTAMEAMNELKEFSWGNEPQQQPTKKSKKTPKKGG